MTERKFNLLNALRGSYRIAPRSAPGIKRAEGFRASGEDKGRGEEPNWLAASRRLIPGEALTGYLSFQPVSKLATNPRNVTIIVALVFLLVTLVLRLIGSQDPDAGVPGKTTEWPIVIISALSFVSLVYASGAQIWWHPAFPDQQLYGQIAAVALGILGPTLYRWFSRQ